MKSHEMQIEILPSDLTSFAKTSILAFLVLLNLEVEQMGFLLAAVFVDSFFGVIKSVRFNEKFDNRKFIWGIFKKLSILFIPFMLAGFGLLFQIDLLYIVQAFIYIIAANDVISILANILSIYSGKKYETVDFIEKGIHMMIGTLTTVVETFMAKLTKSKDETPKDPNQPES